MERVKPTIMLKKEPMKVRLIQCDDDKTPAIRFLEVALGARNLKKIEVKKVKKTVLSDGTWFPKRVNRKLSSIKTSTFQTDIELKSVSSSSHSRLQHQRSSTLSLLGRKQTSMIGEDDMKGNVPNTEGESPTRRLRQKTESICLVEQTLSQTRQDIHK